MLSLLLLKYKCKGIAHLGIWYLHTFGYYGKSVHNQCFPVTAIIHLLIHNSIWN